MSDFKLFLNDYEKCQKCNEILPKSMLERGYTLYANHFYGYKFMIILQNPLYNKKRYEKERAEVEKSDTLKERVKVHQKYFLEWFIKGNSEKRKSKNYDFIERFLNLLKNKNIVYYNSVNEYLHQKFFDDFYVADIIKYWGMTKEVKNNHLEHSTEHLIKEIKKVKPELIFSFSTRVWDNLYRVMSEDAKLQPIRGWKEIKKTADCERKPKKIVNVHGYLFKGFYSKGNEFYILPLVHLSTNARYNLLRDSYFQYMREGLEDYAKITARIRSYRLQ